MDGQLPAPDLKLLLRLLLALALSLITWYGLRYPYSCLVTSVGAKALSWSSGMPADEVVRVREGRFYLDTGLRDPGGRPKPFVQLPVNQVHWNSIIFLSLVYIMTWPLVRRCWKYLLLALLILAASHVAFFTLTVLGEVASRHRAEGIDIFSAGTIRALAISVQTYSLIFEKAVPFLLFIPIVMAWRRPPAADAGASGEKVGRNAPCPCGSGRKYKHCCLR